MVLVDWTCDRFGDFVNWAFEKLHFLEKFFPETQENGKRQEAPSVYAAFFKEVMHAWSLPGTFAEFIVIFIVFVVILPIFYIFLSFVYYCH